MTLTVDIWSDVVCPWCYIGKARFLAGLADFPHRDEVEIRFHSFELDPDAVPGEEEPIMDRLAQKYGVTISQAEGMETRVRDAAHGLGLEFGGERLHGSTFDIHRLLHYALDHGRQIELVDLVFAAHFGGTANVFDHEVLLDLAAQAGLDRVEAAAVLIGDEYADAVRADETLASELGVSGVPFFVMGARYAVSGGQDPSVFTDVLQQAWDELADAPA
jgi:predicted DsbA family dithiol-disulfide isomerase